MAAHSVLVSSLCPTRETQAWALFHDAEEAFTCDLPRGLKAWVNGVCGGKYGELQDEVSDLIIAKFLSPNGVVVDDKVKSFVKQMDDMVNTIEFEYFMGAGLVDLRFGGRTLIFKTSKDECDHARVSRELFVTKCKELDINE